MNIAFYGKGGSGKTTLSALFATYLDSKDYRVGLLDVDVNSHTADVIGVTPKAVLSDEKNQLDIQRYLAGENSRVKPGEFLNTTPPGSGSGSWSFDSDNYLTRTYGTPFGTQSHIFTVGSYTPDQIGIDCHHSTQMIAENMISHAQFSKNDVLVIDSVAGPDAFGTSLYLNDILILVVKPEREGIDVMKRFLDLAEVSNVSDRVVVIGNQVTSDVQRSFLEREVPTDKLVGILPTNDTIIERRLNGDAVGLESIDDAERTVFDAILAHANKLTLSPDERRQAIINLHKKVANEPWVAGAYRTGLEDQIDETFTYGR